MKSEHLFLMIVGGFFSALLIFLVILYKPILPFGSNQSSEKNVSGAASSDKDIINDLKSQVRGLDKKVEGLSQQQKDQVKALEDLKATVSSQLVKPTSVPVGNKSILAVAHTKGSLFTTTSAGYTPMGMYVNVNCAKSCYLWINFYTSSKNLGSPPSAMGNINTYDVFLDNSDQSIFAQASYSADSASVPVAINVTIPVGAGVHTIDIRAKTTGGTLQSDSSALQVMAIER